jgi:hypothetical protein
MARQGTGPEATECAEMNVGEPRATAGQMDVARSTAGTASAALPVPLSGFASHQVTP